MSATEPRTCRRHTWSLWPEDGTTPIPYRCVRCHKLFDPETSRRGRSSSRLGKDQERRAERRYGWEKIGERGEKTDLRGRFAKVQQKASRKAPPAMTTFPVSYRSGRAGRGAYSVTNKADLCPGCCEALREWMENGRYPEVTR